MKRIIEMVMLTALIGVGTAVLFSTGGPKARGRNSGYHPVPDKNNVAYDEKKEFDPKDAVKLAPFLPTPMCVVEKMLELADVDENDIVYDLGCGDGRIVITAAKKYGARGVGLDIFPQWVKKSRENARKAGVDSFVEFRLEDATKADISEATVVALYLLPESNDLLRPLLEKQLRPGACIVTHNYHIPGWGDREICVASLEDDFGKEHTVFVYRP
ncbi:MAG: methyltransferase domain-containing protein [Candidatus Aminicenantes bacterium]